MEKLLAENGYFPTSPLAPEEVDKYIEEAMKDVRNQGNMALYHGLVLHITELALEKVQNPVKIYGPVENRTRT